MSVGLTNPTSRVEPCLWCGGEIVATRQTELEIIAAVNRHQAEPRHVAARAQVERDERIEIRAARAIEDDLARELYGSATSWRSA
jgi:hypothetical protein